MNNDLTKRLQYCTTLPSLPAIAIKIIDCANDPNTDINILCNHIALDPALTAKLLKIANSPLYKSRRTATNIRQALSLLGTHSVIVISLSFTLANSLIKNTNVEPTFDNSQFWRQSITSALACRAIGEKLNVSWQDDLFLAGLLQEIGILTFYAIIPEEYSPVFSSTNDHDTLLQKEREKFGTGHDELGYALLKQWHIPDYIALVCLSSHGQPEPKSFGPTLQACAVTARYLADYFLTPDDPQKLTNLSQTARSWLDIDETILTETIDIMADKIHDIEDLFDMKIHDSSEISGILSQAKELLSIHSLTKVQELEEKSYRDGLTGAHNRSFFDENLKQEFNLAIQHNLPLTIVMIDIDHFKQINDTYGHIVGDGILIAVTRTILGQIRQDDMLSRYGGEEFSLILPGTTLLASRHITYRLKDAIAEMEYQNEDNTKIRITVSIGVAAYLQDMTEFVQPEDMVKAADSALYAAKRAGRNQVIEWNNS